MIFNKLIIKEKDMIQLMISSLNNKEHLSLTYLNQHCFNIYNSHSEYRKLLNNNFAVFIDGFGIYAALKLLGYKDVQKFNASDLYNKIFAVFSKERIKFFLIGGNFKNDFISDITIEKKLNICGYQNGYFEDENLDSIIGKIKISTPEVIVLGMGVPKQELLAAKISDSIPGIIILCVGGFLEFYFGTIKRVPQFFKNSGFEWFYRFLQEPARLWKRYFLGIPLFLYNVIKIKLSNKKN